MLFQNFLRITPIIRLLTVRVLNNTFMNKKLLFNLKYENYSTLNCLLLPNHPELTLIRSYAKNKDKKKDRKNVKIEINEQLLSSVLNLETLNNQMQKSLDIMKEEFIKNLSIRSTTGSVETIKVNVDGKEHELQELAQVIRKNPKTIVINMIAFPQTIPATLQAIQKSGMNLNPQQDGTTIFIPVPKVTKEHRENLSKNAKMLYQKCKDSIRDIQLNQIKKIKKQTDISSDDSHNIQNQLIAIADKYIGQAENLLDIKQNELIGGSTKE